jgi:hydroxymethyl cephem carbamoyltransferase
MKILAYKPGHDGHIVWLVDGNLEFSIEREKDSGPRYGAINTDLWMRAFELMDGEPDVLAVSGWARRWRPMGDFVEAGYFGETAENIIDRPHRFLGRDIRLFSSSHERSHLLGSYAMSPFAQGEPVYALVWEGMIGSFYRIDEALKIEKLGTPLEGPGHKYSFIYGLADSGFPIDAPRPRHEDAGKLMALASYGTPRKANAVERDLIDKVFAWPSLERPVRKDEFLDSPYLNVGLYSQKFRDLAWQMQQAVFERFHAFAKEHMREGFPLLVSGGCGLNCDWNSAWKQSGLFADVFVPPCANDSGSAIGTAADAQWHLTGSAKIAWSVYAGEDFILDEADLSGFTARPRDNAEIAARLAAGDVIAWVQGKYEIGPRALGNRSLLAAPFTSKTHQRLNTIKQREAFRPIAPICMEEEIDRLFDHHGPSPHMLFFQKVRTDAIKAVTHVDGSARLQSVTAEQNPQMHDLLTTFKRETGYGIVCNTSLNFKGTGFINRLSDLVRYAREHGLDGFVVGDSYYRRD